MYLSIYGQIYLKTFCKRRKCSKLLKLASTTGEMFKNTLFSFCGRNLCSLWFKNPIFDVEFSIYLLIFQSLIVFYIVTAFCSPICSKKPLICDSKHFHGRRFNFHDINVQSTTGNLISNWFMPNLWVNCKKRSSKIYKLTLMRALKYCESKIKLLVRD